MKKIKRIIIIAGLISLLSIIFTITSSAASTLNYIDEDGNTYTFALPLLESDFELTDFTPAEPDADVVLPSGSELGAIYTEITNEPFDLSQYSLIITTDAFSETDIKSIVIPEGSIVESKAFYHCEELETVEMHGRFSTNSSYTFEGCTMLKNVILGDNITELPKYAFTECISLENIDLNNVKTIGEGTFRNCSSLTTVKAENLQIIGDYGFQVCSNLKSISSPLLNILGKYGFSECTSLETVDFPSVTTMKDSAFSLCYSLKSINIPKIRQMPSFAFYDCTSLESITLPVTTSIEMYAFYSCSSLESIEAPHIASIDAFAFYQCASLKTINFPVLPTVGEYAFYECTSLESIDVRSLTSIERYGFSNCTSLVTINAPLLRSIGTYAFSDCASLTSFDFLIIEELGNYAFKGCTSLGICRNYHSTSVPAGLFSGCTSLYYFDFSKITKVGSSAFHNCKSLDIPYLMNVTSIGSYAFSGCDKILTVRLIGATYGYGVYSNCKNLQNIYITSNVSSLRTNENNVSLPCIFEGCENVEYIYISSKFNGKSYNTTTGYHSNCYDDLSLHEFKKLKKIEIDKNNPFFYVSDDVVYYENDSTLILLCYLNNKTGEEFVTPDTDKIFEISPFAFSDTKYLKKVIFTKTPALSAESICYIREGYSPGDYAFLNSSVEEIVMPNGALKYVPVGMFKDSQIKTIDLSEIEYINKNAFENCSNLISIEMPLCTEIFDEAFMGCKNLESIRIPRLIYIGEKVFGDCSNLKRINLSSVHAVYTDTFENCINLEIIEFSEKTISIEGTPFSNCPKLAFYCDKDTYAHEYAVTNNIPVVVLTVSFQKNIHYEYTGKEIRPSVIVAIDDMALVENQDYVLTYSNNINLGLGLVNVHFIGYFEGLDDIERTFLIEPRHVSTLKIEYVVDNEYSGEEIRPKVVVKNGTLLLVENFDYTITYSGHPNTGTMFFTITGNGNYTGSLDCYYNIIRRDIAEATVSKDTDMVYTGEQLKPKPVITWNGFTLIENQDYEIRYFENVNSGYGIMVIYGMGNFCGAQRIQFKIFGKNIENATISEISDYLYTGSEITPDVTVTLGDLVLTKDVDYVVKYENNIEKGVATVLVSGIGNYSGVVKQTFNINKHSVYSFTVFSETEMTSTYNGTPLKPEMEVYFGTELLTEGVDYKVVLENNVNAGTATVTIIGMGIYDGERSYNFTILPCEITENDVSVKGNEITIIKNGEVLVNGVDYTVTYSDNSVGTGIATIQGIGNYCETVQVEYTIEDDSNQPDNPGDDDDVKLSFWQLFINFIKLLFGIK